MKNTSYSIVHISQSDDGLPPKSSSDYSESLIFFIDTIDQNMNSIRHMDSISVKQCQVCSGYVGNK